MSGQLVLIVDTSVFGLWLALANKSSASLDMITDLESSESLASSHKLIEYLSRGLESRGLSFDQITDIAVSVGPGSFTGIKVGLAHIFGLVTAVSEASKSKHRRLYSFSALEYVCKQLHGQVSHAKTHLFLRASERKGAVAITEEKMTRSFSWQSDNAEDIPSLEKAASVIFWRPWEAVELKYGLRDASYKVSTLSPESRYLAMQNSMKTLVSEISSGQLLPDQGLPQPRYLRDASLFGK